jgi:phospholipid/cholesterol/gamma-HCH transport system substrate-binding protein
MKKYSMETVVGIFMVVGLLCVGYITIHLGKVPVLRDDSYTLFARFTSVAGLRIGSPVNVFGIEVGRVTRMGIDNERQVAWISIKISNDVHVYSDATATIKTMGLIGDKFIRIDPGGAGELLKPRSTITNTVASPDIEDLMGKYIFGQASPGNEADKQK